MTLRMRQASSLRLPSVLTVAILTTTTIMMMSVAVRGFLSPRSLSVSHVVSSSAAKNRKMLLLRRGQSIWSISKTRRHFASTTENEASVLLTEALSSQLNDPSLLLDWQAPVSNDNLNKVFGVYDPAAPDMLLAQVPSIGSATTMNSIIEASHEALVGQSPSPSPSSSWRDGTTAQHRSRLLTEWSRLIGTPEHAQDLATIMTLESGKPLAESKGEIAYAASFLDYYAAEAIRSSNAGGGVLIPTPFTDGDDDSRPRGQLMARHQAVGVTAMITPWNFPAAMMTRKVGPALAAGCTALVKPSELTPLTAIALVTLARRAGIPEDVVQLVTASTEDTPMVGRAVCEHPKVRKVSFTGSTKVGKWLMEHSASTVKRLSLELGGNAPFVVFADADLDQAVAAAMASKFRNAGQTCVCADRFLIHSSLHDAFVDKLLVAVTTNTGSRVGPGIDPKTTMGPLISVAAVDAVAQKVEDAIRHDGAICLLGGTRLPELGPHFYAPTILTNVDAIHSDIWKTETFGPVVAIRSFETEEEALGIANDSTVGLASYFCTKDLGRAFRVAERLECGIVGVNEGIISTATAPFGGIKESGLGREGSTMGLAEYLETKYIMMNF